MSKGKPIKLSTTLFVFYAQSSKVGEGSYYLGMGKVWSSNSNLGSHPFFENVFLASWASKCLERNSQPIIHPCVCFLTQLEIDGAFSLVFLQISSFFPWMEVRFGQCLVTGLFPGHFLFLIPHYPARGKTFFGCTMSGRRNP